MKKVLLFGSTLATTLAAPTADNRRLAIWDQETEAGSDGCHFMPSSKIFAYHVDAGFTAATPDAASEYTNEGSTSIGDWNDASVAIHLGTFAIDFILDNKQIADSNYNYYKFASGAWSLETGFSAVAGSSRASKDEMVTVCFYKNAEPTACNGATYKQEVTVAFPTTTSTTATDTTAPVTIALRKILGVSSQCGSGDTGYDLDGGAKDIFVWSDLQASNSVDYTITINLVNEYGNGVDPGAGGLAAVTEGAVQYSITVNHDHKVHDLLFVEGELASAALKSAGTFDNNPEEDLEFNYFVGYDASGAFSRDAKSVAVSCESTLTVDAQGNTDGSIPNRDGHWHCYRGTATKVFPTGGASSDEVTADGSALSTLNKKAPTDRHSACTAKLVVDCTVPASLDITGSDTRACAEGNATYTEEMDGQVGKGNNEEDCLQSDFWLRQYDYAAYDPIEISYEAAIVQAVRLRNTRKYPKDVSNKQDGDSVATLFPAAQTANWECDTTTCANEDPYKILYAASGTTSVNCGSLTTKGQSDGTISGLDAGATTWTQSCSATNPGLDSGAKTLNAPPTSFPESYVFAAVSYQYTTRTQSVGITQAPGSSEANVTGVTTSADAVNDYRGIDASVVGNDTVNNNARRLNAVHENRLRALKTKKPSHSFFQVIEAVQHVVQ